MKGVKFFSCIAFFPDRHVEAQAAAAACKRKTTVEEGMKKKSSDRKYVVRECVHIALHIICAIHSTSIHIHLALFFSSFPFLFYSLLVSTTRFPFMHITKLLTTSGLSIKKQSAVLCAVLRFAAAATATAIHLCYVFRFVGHDQKAPDGWDGYGERNRSCFFFTL